MRRTELSELPDSPYAHNWQSERIRRSDEPPPPLHWIDAALWAANLEFGPAMPGVPALERVTAEAVRSALRDFQLRYVDSFSRPLEPPLRPSEAAEVVRLVVEEKHPFNCYSWTREFDPADFFRINAHIGPASLARTDIAEMLRLVIEQEEPSSETRQHSFVALALLTRIQDRDAEPPQRPKEPEHILSVGPHRPPPHRDFPEPKFQPGPRGELERVKDDEPRADIAVLVRNVLLRVEEPDERDFVLGVRKLLAARVEPSEPPVQGEPDTLYLGPNGKRILLGEKELGWRKLESGRGEVPRYVSTTNAEGRLLMSLVLPGRGRRPTRPEVATHLKQALEGAGFNVDERWKGKGDELKLAPKPKVGVELRDVFREAT